jgi:DNA-directed RNA polymerase specialized sigma24 family protein
MDPYQQRRSGRYARLYVFYYKRLYNYGRKFTGDMIILEDALQEALLSIWTGRQRLTQVDNPHTYLLSTFHAYQRIYLYSTAGS